MAAYFFRFSMIAVYVHFVNMYIEAIVVAKCFKLKVTLYIPISQYFVCTLEIFIETEYGTTIVHFEHLLFPGTLLTQIIHRDYFLC